MAAFRNQHGLSRYIAVLIRREIRKRDGFGCVVCGLGIYQYEHVDPPFSEAIKHEAKNITLLCAQCHDKVTRGIMAKETVKTAMLMPKCKRAGFAHEQFDFNGFWPKVMVGTVGFIKCHVPVMICGRPVLRIWEPEEAGGPFQISAEFLDAEDEPMLIIDKNEWRAYTKNWDVEVQGSAIIIRDAHGDVRLAVRTKPPGEILFEKIDVSFAGWRVRTADDDYLKITDPSGKERGIANITLDLGGAKNRTNSGINIVGCRRDI